MRRKARYLVRGRGPDGDAAGKAWKWTLELAARDSAGSKVVIVVPSKHEAEDTVLAEALGVDLVKALLKKRPSRVRGVSVSMESTRTFEKAGDDADIVLLAYADKRMLDAVHDAIHPQYEVVLSWRDEDVEDWELTWSPSGPDEPLRQPASFFSSPAVEKTLSSISANPRHLMHPLDKDRARKRIPGLPITEDRPAARVRAWALRSGFTSTAADKFHQIALRALGR